MKEVGVSRVNSYLNSLRVGSRELEEKKKREIQTAAEDVVEMIDTLADTWEEVGLSGREAEVAAYKQLGFTNKATAWMLELSPNTVNEYDRRAKQKIKEARRLVGLADRTEAFEKDWLCPNCREGIRRSHGDIEVSGRSVSYTCRKCFEDFERRVHGSEVAVE